MKSCIVFLKIVIISVQEKFKSLTKVFRLEQERVKKSGEGASNWPHLAIFQEHFVTGNGVPPIVVDSVRSKFPTYFHQKHCQTLQTDMDPQEALDNSDATRQAKRQSKLGLLELPSESKSTGKKFLSFLERSSSERKDFNNKLLEVIAKTGNSVKDTELYSRVDSLEHKMDILLDGMKMLVSRKNDE